MSNNESSRNESISVPSVSTAFPVFLECIPIFTHVSFLIS